MLRLLLLSVLALSWAASVGGEGCKRVVCYHTNWSQYRPGPAKFFPKDIDPSLCTHVIYSFAEVKEQLIIETREWNDDKLMADLQALKTQNPDLKTLVAIGGWNQASKFFTQVVKTKSSRDKFIKQSIQFLHDHGFDGLDLDWEYPTKRGGNQADKANFAAWVQELREAYNKESPRLLLTAAVAAGKATVDAAYDIPTISEHLDFINLMAYDLHGSWESTTGHNSPLYSRATHQDQLNVAFAAEYWVKKGCPANKLVVGLPLYGRSFTLTSGNTGVGAPASKGALGQYTREGGFLAYYEVCQMEAEGGTKGYIEDQEVPYMYHGKQWVGYDDPDSLRNKVRFVKEHNYGGVMVWALPLDDFKGQFCGQGPFPLMHAINDECGRSTGSGHTTSPGGHGTTPQRTTRPPRPTDRPQTSRPATTSSTHSEGVEDCEGRPDGQYASTTSCEQYVVCSNGIVNIRECAPDTIYNADGGYCDWPQNYPCDL